MTTASRTTAAPAPRKLRTLSSAGRPRAVMTATIGARRAAVVGLVSRNYYGSATRSPPTARSRERELQQVAVDVREDRELAAARAQLGERRRHLGERPPLADRGRERRRDVGSDRDIERLKESSADAVEDVLVEVVTLRLELGLHGYVPLGERLAARTGRRERQEGIGDPALPVDERAVAVERDPLDGHLAKPRQDRRGEVRALLEPLERFPRGRRATAGLEVVRALGHALQCRSRVESAQEGRQVEVSQAHEPVAIVVALVVDRRRREPALEPLLLPALLEDARAMREVARQKPARLVLVDDLAERGARSRIGARIEVADLIEDREDPLDRAGPDSGRGRRGLRQTSHERAERAVLAIERRAEGALARLLPLADRRVERFEVALELGDEARDRGRVALVHGLPGRSPRFPAKRRATSLFGRRSSCSTPSALTNATRSSSEPKPERGSLTSFATTRSSFFSRSMRPASAVASPVSALKPTTIVPGLRAATIALSTSGFSMRRSVSSRPSSFFFSLRSTRSIGR